MLSEWCDLIEEEHVSRISRKTTLIGAVVALALIGALAAGFVLLRPPRTNAWEFTGPNRAEIVTLAFDPATPTTLYAGADDGVYKSEDGGVTWRTANRRLPGVRTLAVDPAAPTTVYAGTKNGAYKSDNGGATWRAINNGLGERPAAYALTLDPANSQIVYAGTRNGVYRRVIDAEQRWRPFQ